jgi:nucleotide-binding universal stress UspA family protein
MMILFRPILKGETTGAKMTLGISKIMVGIDGSEESVNAADYAIAIAKRHNAELIAVNVLTSDIVMIIRTR